MFRTGIEPGPPRWEASTLEKSHSNSLLTVIRNIYILHMSLWVLYFKTYGSIGNYLVFYCPLPLKAAWKICWYWTQTADRLQSCRRRAVSQFCYLFQEGQQHAVMLYTWRCCSRAIPQPKVHCPPTSVADPGSGSFLTPGSGIRDG